ncbi:hypothetical protein BGX28_000336 [Mortierella sp. GBA30]|nr:hypothetical protein BGX28_000336 [Mortierella sp. GBA30]
MSVYLKSCDNQIFQVDKVVALRSNLIKTVINDIGDSDQPIYFSNISSTILQKVIDYCEHHRHDPLEAEQEDKDNDKNKTKTKPKKVVHPSQSIQINNWDRCFMEVDQETLFEILLAAKFLEIEPLLELSLKSVANIIKGKSPEELRQVFNLEMDFTPEEESAMIAENEWAHD